MAGNILDSMTEQYNSLTRSGKKLADYIFTHTSETQYMSIKMCIRDSIKPFVIGNHVCKFRILKIISLFSVLISFHLRIRIKFQAAYPMSRTDFEGRNRLFAAAVHTFTAAVCKFTSAL